MIDIGATLHVTLSYSDIAGTCGGKKFHELGLGVVVRPCLFC